MGSDAAGRGVREGPRGKGGGGMMLEDMRGLLLEAGGCGAMIICVAPAGCVRKLA